MSVLLVGDKGRMGKRYKAILDATGENIITYDITDDIRDYPKDMVDSITHAVIATPTNDHHQSILLWNSILKNVSILCEKPIIKTTPKLLAKLFLDVEKTGNRLFCVNQYCYLSEYEDFKKAKGPTEYKYFHSGDDGPHWDLFQLYALAKQDVTLYQSRFWGCTINGIEITNGLTQMDKCYVDMMFDFLGKQERFWSQDHILKTHIKIWEL